jgi:hypothetical protein
MRASGSAINLSHFGAVMGISGVWHRIGTIEGSLPSCGAFDCRRLLAVMISADGLPRQMVMNDIVRSIQTWSSLRYVTR